MRDRTHTVIGAGGFTLIELMIVVGVVAILAAVALPSYQSHITKTRRSAAAACSLEAAQFMERFYTTNLSYAKTKMGVDVALPTGQCSNDLDDHYTIRLSPTAKVSAKSYTIEAVPKGVQKKNDVKCGMLSLDQTGRKAVDGTASADPKQCW